MNLSPEAERFIRRHIKKHKKEYRMKQSQAVAVALEEARTKGYKVPASTRMERL